MHSIKNQKKAMKRRIVRYMLNLTQNKQRDNFRYGGGDQCFIKKIPLNLKWKSLGHWKIIKI